MSITIEQIQSPKDLKSLTPDELVQLAQSLRDFLCESLNKTGGHFGAGLGVIELTLALHYLYDTPEDKIIWDVGHQAYPHKILTERLNLFHTIRQKDGLAPFPCREESPYDAFGVGHSSTSISAACGMAIAMEKMGKDNHAVAVIGDGAMTAGMAFEALNHAGDLKTNMLVILNDNDMSISGNVGALSNYFARILSSKLYSSVKTNSKRVLGRIPPVWEFARKTESHLKGMIAPGTLFEELGWNYIGPVDGHNLPSLIKTLQNIKNLSGPQLLHVSTQKGKGYAPAEENPIKYHAVTKGFYQTETNVAAEPKAPSMPSYSQVFGDWLCDMAEADQRIVGITPAMCEGSGMVEFRKKFPKRYFDVAIAEQHSVTLAAGMACENLKPVVAIYSSFLQRAYDQLIHDVALQNLPVLFALDRAGVVGDGPTHSGNFDFSFLRCIPNMIIMAPSDANECRNMLYTGIQCNAPATVRYPRGAGPTVDISKTLEALPLGKGEIRRERKQALTGHSIAILSFGSFLPTAIAVGEILDATVANMRFVKPLDETLILKLAKQHDTIVTLEENVVKGGAGSGVNEFLAQTDLSNQIINLGLPDYFLSHGDPEKLLADCQLDKAGICHTILERVKHRAQFTANNTVEI